MFNNIIPDSAEIVVSSTEPSNPNEAMMWYNPTLQQLSIYESGAFAAITAGSAAVNRYIYNVGVASGDYDGISTTVFPAIYSTASVYAAIEVYVNGVHMTQGNDFTATTTTDITLTVAANASDEIVIVAWGDVSQTTVATDYDDTDVQTYLTNNSYATENYVTTQIASVVDAAPATLDTLNEIAAALGDDANYAATVTTSIATKLAITDFDSTFDTRLALKTTADVAETSSVDNKYMTDAEKAKLTNIEASATADQTGAEIKALYEAEADTNALTDALNTKLAGIETSATADQTGAEIKVAYEAEADTNAFADADVTKLAGIDALALNAANVRTEMQGADLDLGTNKVLFSNVYATTGDLPAASSYHGMFAHVHAEGKAYFAHSGAWVALASEALLLEKTPEVFTAQISSTGKTAVANLGTTSGPKAIEVIIKAVQGNEIELTKFLCVIDGLFNVHFTEFGEVFSSNSLYTADVIDSSGASGNLEIFVTGTSATTTDYTVTVINR
jgi:hypothetical protein